MPAQAVRPANLNRARPARSQPVCAAAVIPFDRPAPAHVPRASSFRSVSLSLLAAITAAGCGGDEIRRYQVPKLETLAVASPHRDPAAQRMLAVVFPRKDRTWFFKLVGPAALVGDQKAAFDSFMGTVRFHDQADKPISWTAPDGWRVEGASGMRYATFRINTRDQPLDLSVTSLGPEAATLLPNVNRWREQLGLGPIGEAELGSVVTRREIEGAPVSFVDLTGPGGTSSPMQAPFASRSPSSPALEPGGATERPSFTYTTPAGWTEDPNPQGMRVAAFHVGDAGRRVEITIVPLPGPAGGLVQNVNRWRGQIGLQPADETQVRKEIQPFDLAGNTAHYIDLLGPEAAAGRQRIVGVVLPRADQTWFFKMQGPADLVAGQKTAFEAFVRSVRFAAEGQGQSSSSG